MASSDSESNCATHSARLSYNDFEIAIKAFKRQTERHAPWSYIEYRLAGVGDSSRDVIVSAADQLLLDDLAEHFEEIPDEEAQDLEATTDPAISEVVIKSQFSRLA
ncbi:hypothetical protein BGX27_002307 [Mortierella sp. AM989]|nr:hypothetical protein BGX27_002307 [Mortierella sp. AM989]